MKTKFNLLALVTLALLSTINSQLSTASAQGTAFTYQGQLQNNGGPANGTYNLQFLLYNNSAGGAAVAGPVVTYGVTVTNGLFTVPIDFGAGVWNGTAYWLEVDVETNGAASFTILAPRQPLTPAPYAIFAESANSAGLSGTIPNSSLSPDVALLDGTQTFTGANSFNQSLKLNGNDLSLENNPASGLGFRSSVAGLSPSGGLGAFLYGFDVGYLGTVNPDEVSLFWDFNGNVWVSNNLSTASLTLRGASSSGALSVSGNNLNVNAGFLVVDGLSPVYCYLGDDGSGNDVQIGSQESGVTNLSCYNTADNAYMNVFCNSINAAGSFDCNSGSIDFGATARQMLSLYSNSVTTYAIGVQNQDLYFRCGADVSGTGFAWFRGGTPNSNPFNNGGGATLMTLTASGLTVNGTLVSSSDRNMKQDFAPVDSQQVLQKVSELPVETWSFKQDPATRHLGPTAQDFYAAFGTGADDKHIAVVDEGGVALAAIQGLNNKVEGRSQKEENQIEELKTVNARLKEKNDSLEKRLEALEQIILKQKPN